MRINKLFEKFVDNNDIYILEYHEGTVIVNNNYSGIKLYNEKLELMKTIHIFEGIIIHTIFKNPLKNEIILYCPDNQVFVYLNLDTSFQKIINFIGDIDEIGLSDIYYWSGQEVLFKCGNKRYYKIESVLLVLKELNSAVVEKEYPIFYSMLNESSRYLLLEGGAQKLTFKDTINKEILNIDYKNNIKVVSSIPDKLGHEVIFIDGVFLSVHEEFIQVIKEGKEAAKIDTVTPYTFLRARKLTEQNAIFIALRGNKSNPQQCVLSCYHITK